MAQNGLLYVWIALLQHFFLALPGVLTQGLMIWRDMAF